MLENNLKNPANFVLFGCDGDLAMRKLLPALYRLFKHGHLPSGSRVIGASLSDHCQESFANLVRFSLQKWLEADEFDEEAWREFRPIVHFSQLDAYSQKSFLGLKDLIQSGPTATNIYYFSTPPNIFGEISSNLSDLGLIKEDSCVVLEKPIGEDLESSRVINDEIAIHFNENQIYRIDHYLGKETVQNLLSVRFANALFEPLWNSNVIDHVQITVAETIGVEGRWAYYNNAGALRDMVQNHLLQLLCLVAMEPPSSMDADAVRDEKLKVLKALRPISERNVHQRTVRGQYEAGVVHGEKVPSYLDGQDTHTSNTETFVALRAEIDNWRWSGVPFYLRTGKRMPVRYSEIVIQFKDVPHSIFNDGINIIGPNKLIIRLQPEESIQLVIMNKVPGLEEAMKLRAVPLNLMLSEAFDYPRTPAAYERLLLDVFRNNQTLFMRRDEIEAAWQWIDRIQKGWKGRSDVPFTYESGSWGPQEASELVVRDGRSWHD